MNKNKETQKGEEIPLYVEAYNKLLDEIKSMPQGSRLPSENILAKRFNISRNTLRQALQILQEDKIIYKRRGSGTYVSGIASLNVISSLNEYCTIETLFKKQNIDVDLIRFEITIEESDDVCSSLLDLPSHTSLMVISRVYAKKGQPKVVYAQLLDFVPYSIFLGASPSFDKKEIVKYVDERGRLAQTTLIATHAGKLNSEPMHVTEDTPLLLLQQLVMGSTGEKLYLNKTYLNSQAMEFGLCFNRN